MKINTNEITIKLCTENDVDTIYSIQQTTIKYFKAHELGYFLPFKKESYQRIVNNPINDGEIYGAFYHDKMIAWIFLSVAPRMEELKSKLPDIKGTCADIDGILVLPEYRGNNLQNILVKYLEQRCKELGINNVIAEVTFGNNYSLRNLEDSGYKIKTYYQKDKNIKRYILLKELKNTPNI